jgi:hypothetical protein
MVGDCGVQPPFLALLQRQQLVYKGLFTFARTPY